MQRLDVRQLAVELLHRPGRRHLPCASGAGVLHCSDGGWHICWHRWRAGAQSCGGEARGLRTWTDGDATIQHEQQGDAAQHAQQRAHARLLHGDRHRSLFRLLIEAAPAPVVGEEV